MACRSLMQPVWICSPVVGATEMAGSIFIMCARAGCLAVVALLLPLSSLDEDLIHPASDLRNSSNCFGSHTLLQQVGSLREQDQQMVLQVLVGPGWVSPEESGGFLAWRRPLEAGDARGKTPLVAGSSQVGGEGGGGGEFAIELRDIVVGGEVVGFTALPGGRGAAGGAPSFCYTTWCEREGGGRCADLVAVHAADGAVMWHSSLIAEVDGGSVLGISNPTITRDFDGDGVSDVLAALSAGPSGDLWIRILSGRDGRGVGAFSVPSLLKDVAHGLGVSASGAGQALRVDVIHSHGLPSLPEVMLAVRWFGGGAWINLDVKAKAVRVIATFERSKFDNGGVAVSAEGGAVLVPDMNGDGIQDVALGFPHSSGGGEVTSPQSGAGVVEFRDGITGELIHWVLGDRADEEFGLSLLLYEDMDGDGVADLLVASPARTVSDAGHPGARVRLYSTAKRQFIAEWPSHSPEFVEGILAADGQAAVAMRLLGLGSSMALRPDLDGDGRAELLVSIASGVAVSSEALFDCPESGLLWLTSRAFSAD